MKSLITLCLFVGLCCVACKSNESADATKNTPKSAIVTADQTTTDQTHNGHVHTQAKQDKVKAKQGLQLTPEGQKFEPPIKAEALPIGAYYCDMGTVHYARSEKGDSSCPICQMKLSQKK